MTGENSILWPEKFPFSFSLSRLLIITYFSRCLAWLEMTLLPKINTNIYLEAQHFAWLKTTYSCNVSSGKAARSDIPISLCPQTFISVLQFIAFSIALVQQLLRISCKLVSYKVPGFRKTTKQKMQPSTKIERVWPEIKIISILQCNHTNSSVGRTEAAVTSDAGLISCNW